MIFSDLTIITISLNADASLLRTFNSIQPLLLNDIKWIVVLTNRPKDLNYLESAHLIIGKDKGLYNALNIGIETVSTDYFMLIHAGDTLINYNSFIKSFNLIRTEKLDLVLGGARIGKRTHISKKWKPWMFQFNIQPPHLPIIYNTNFIDRHRFDESIPVISDFYMLKEIFDQNPNYKHSGNLYISMELGGLTSSGIKSFFLVTKLFNKVNEDNIIQSLIKFYMRILLKLYLR